MHDMCNSSPAEMLCKNTNPVFIHKGKKSQIKNKIFIKYLEYEIIKYIYFKDIAKKPSFMHEIT